MLRRPFGGLTPIARFLLVSIPLGMTMQLLAAGVGTGRPVFLLGGVAMWSPAIGALCAGRDARRTMVSALTKLQIRWTLLGAGIGLILPLSESAILRIAGLGSWNEGLFPIDATGLIASPRMHLLFGAGPQTASCFALNLALTTGLVATVLTFAGAVGEELGWRVFLQEWLGLRFGQGRGAVLVGLVWGYWHIPINLLGHNDAVHPWMTALLLFPCGTVLMSLVYWQLYERGGKSVWPVALAHAVNNAGAFKLVVPSSWLVDQVVTLVPLTVAAVLFLRFRGPTQRVSKSFASRPRVDREASGLV